MLFSFHLIFDVSQAADLAGKKCVPCNSKDIRAMSEQSANELLVQVQAVPLGYFLFLFLLKGKMYCNIFIMRYEVIINNKDRPLTNILTSLLSI